MIQKIRLAAIVILSIGFSIITIAQPKEGDTVRIKNINSGKYIKPRNFEPGRSGEVVLFAPTSDAQCNWKVIPVRLSDNPLRNLFKFQNIYTKQFLGICNNNNGVYDLICQKSDGNETDLQWRAERTLSGYKLKNRRSNLYLAVEGGGITNNSNLILWRDEGQMNILWEFESVGNKSFSAPGKKVLFDVVLNYIGVSEATRNQIDNGDCKRVFGQVSTELWELDENNELKTLLTSYNSQTEFLFNQRNATAPSPIALSYYQDNLSTDINNQIGKVTYNIPEILLKEKKVMLIVKTNLGTRHKDNDFASYDILYMKNEIRNTYILNFNRTRSETINAITDISAAYDHTVDIEGFVYSITDHLPRKDDTHKIWVKFSTRIN